jgi:hypothetical protein
MGTKLVTEVCEHRTNKTTKKAIFDFPHETWL